MSMVARWPVVGLFLCFVLLDSVFGYCFKDPIKFERTVSGRVRKYCEYKHPPVVNKDAGYIIMFPDSSVFTGDCLACTCTMDGLTCCGFGHQELNFNLPEDCIQLQDGCHGLHVKRQNNSLDCFTGKQISFDTFEPHPDNIFSLPSLVESGGTRVIKVVDSVIKKANKTMQTQPREPTLTTTSKPTIDSIPTKPSINIKPAKPIINIKPDTEQQIIPTVKIPTNITSQNKLPVKSITKNDTRPKQEVTKSRVIDLGVVPVDQQTKGDNQFITFDMLKSGIFPLDVPQSKKVVIPTTKTPFLFPISNFNTQPTRQFLPRTSTQNNLFTGNTRGMSKVGMQNIDRPLNTWQSSVNPYVTATPPPFYPVPYMGTVSDTREDSSSSTSNLFNDLLFNMMMFGAFT